MKSRTIGMVYLLPNYLSEGQDARFIAPLVNEIVRYLDYFLVENIRTSRRFISSLRLGIDISALTFEQMDKRFDPARLKALFEPVLAGRDLGIQSEAGLPGIADPGKLAVDYAHRNGLRVVTLPGSSSIILGLIASGLNGQQFTFHGYLPIDGSRRLSMIKKLESEATNTHYTQVFMETPYRNEGLFQQLLNTLKPGTLLFVGTDLTGRQENVKTLTVGQWKKTRIELHKIPAIFAIGPPQ